MSSETQLEQLVRERTRGLEAAHAALQEREQTLTAELNVLQRLQEIATQLITAQGVEALFETILDAAVATMQSDFASIQVFHPNRGAGGELRLIGHRGLSPEALKRWEWVNHLTSTPCGEALRRRRSVVVPDACRCDFMAGSEDLAAYLDGGIRAAQSTPLVSRTSELVGMISTHWREPYEPTATQLRALDILARFAADLIERSRAEEELQEHNERLRALFNHQMVAINFSSPNKHWVEVNDTWCKMTGYSREELARTDWARMTHSDDLEADLKQFERMAAGEIDQYRLEKRFIRKDGSILEMEISVSCVRNPDGSLRQLIGLGTDISERRLAEKQLRESERRFRSLFDHAFDAMFIGRGDGSVEAANSMACAMLGMTAQELRDRGQNGVILNDKRLQDLRETRRLTGKARGEVSFIRKDGTRREGEVSTVTWGDSGETFVIMRDITERKQAEAALRESEQHLRKAERIAHMGHWQWDLQSNQVSGSEEIYTIFGKGMDFVPTYGGFLDDLTPADRERMQELIKDSLETKAGHSIEYQLNCGDDDPRTISCIWEVLLNEEGAPVRIFGTCQDITESRRTQEESFSRQKLESVGTLAGGIAHDFNNLLGGVMAQAELALNELADGSSPKKELEAIRDVAMRGSEIVRELMIYAGKDSEVKRLLDLSQIVKDMLELLKITVSKHATIETDFGENLPPVWANSAQIRQIVMNLVMNASEAVGERDGVIRVSTSYVEPERDWATVSGRLRDGGHLQLEVSDTGCGMSQETRARVFDPFFTTKSGGHGLGLAVVSGIVRGLDGAIRLNSEPGKGTTFQILLPSAKAESDGPTHTAPSGELTVEPQHFAILIVEDEDILREAVSKMLQNKGFEVFEAANGSSAIDLLRSANSKFDLILLDVTIPGASSQEVTGEAARLHPQARVILTSAYSPDMVTANVEATQVVSFIRKPFRIAELLQTIRQALSA